MKMRGWMLYEFGFLIRKDTTILAFFGQMERNFFLFSKAFLSAMEHAMISTRKRFAKTKYGYIAEFGFDFESVKYVAKIFTLK